MFLAMDVETGDTDPQAHSLLTACFAVVDDGLNVLDIRDFTLKDGSGAYRVAPKALEVNGINLMEHDKNATLPITVNTSLYNWLNTWQAKDRSHRKFIPLGWNVAFDLAFIRTQLPVAWNVFLDYRVMDVQSLNCALSLLGRTQPGGMHQVASALGIDVQGAHTARADTLLTVEVMRRLLTQAPEPATN